MSNGLIIGLIFLLLVLIIFSAFFSAAETAYSSVSYSKVEEKARKGVKSALLIKKHSKKFGWTLATILICNNLVNISSSALITFLFTKLMGATGSVTIISTFVMTPIIVIFGEIFPKLLAKKHSYGYLSKIAYIMEGFNILLFPITYPISKITLQSKITNSETELKSLIRLAKNEGVLDTNEATLASKALDLDSTTVARIMTKRKDVIFVDTNDKVEKVLEKFKESGHSRLPVKENGKFIGLVILKDIFLLAKTKKIKNYIVKIHNISQHILASKALENMRLYKSHMMLVTKNQESNIVVGILTIEDVVEELVGEIYDEHDKELEIREIAHYKWSAKGSTLVSKLEKITELDLEIGEELLTIKQWLQSRINRKIKKGLKYTYKDVLAFKVLSNKNNEDTIFEINKK